MILSGFSTSNCAEKTKRKPVCQVCQLRAHLQLRLGARSLPFGEWSLVSRRRLRSSCSDGTRLVRKAVTHAKSSSLVVHLHGTACVFTMESRLEGKPAGGVTEVIHLKEPRYAFDPDSIKLLPRILNDASPKGSLSFVSRMLTCTSCTRTFPPTHTTMALTTGALGRFETCS